MFVRQKSTIQNMLLIIFVFFINGCTSNCVNNTVGKELLKVSIGDTLPDVPLEKFGNKYYYFGAIYEGNYYQALQYCSYNGMTLLSIETEAENKYLMEKFRAFLGWGIYQFWTSGTILPDDHWVWLTTGKPFLYSNWSPNQPDNAGGNESCLEVNYFPENDSLAWNDNVCTALRHVICENSNVKCACRTEVGINLNV